MINECEIPNVKCISTCDTFSILRGDACFLPISKARMLEFMGVVKIIDKVASKKRAIADNDYLYRYAFSSRRLTRVAWVQNYNMIGGAEISNFEAVKVGQSLGFDVVGIITDSSPTLSIMDHADVIVVNNLHSANREKVFDYLLNTKIPWIKYDHDCKETDSRFFTESTKNIFISPMHKKNYIEKFGKSFDSKSVCLPLAFNTDKWPLQIDGRIKDSVFVPSYTKSRDNLMDYIMKNPDKKYYISGNTRPIGNSFQLGEISPDKMAEQYQRYETVFHQPEYPCAGERILFEAILSGCQVVCNRNCGHASWQWDWRDERVLRPVLNRAIYQLWHEIEEVANGN